MSTTTTAKAAGNLGNWADERVGASKGVKFLARKIFPDHWSFMLGEVALYSFIILLLTGVFLTFFYIPSVGHTVYTGSYEQLAGQTVSEAYASSLSLSFDVRGGLLMRQIHHWSALIFVASIVTHMFRVFFTGAFRKPREINWVIGSVLALLAIVEGFAGYSLPDDLLSGTGLRIASSIILAIPVVGSYISFFLFGGQFPGEEFIPRLYTIHVLLLPGIFLALITAHLILLIVQKHTQYPGPGRTNENVVGYPLFPVYMAKAGGFFFIVFGITALMGALFTINPIWAYGAYHPSPVTAGSQPDWYMGWLDGAVRLTPGFLEFQVLGFTVSGNILLPALIIPGLVTMPMILYPWIEQWATGDKREHHLLDRPRNVPTRTGLGVMAITFYLLLLVSGGNDIIATHLRLSINDITNSLRLLVFVVPPLAYVVTKRICLGLQRKDREKVLHGRETGVIYRTEEGEFFEVHEPLDEHDRWLLVQHDSFRPLDPAPTEDERGVKRPGARFDKVKAKLSSFYFEDRIEPVTPAELEAAHHEHHGGHEAVEGSDEAERPALAGH
ncbi:ubiquinol-cytochrome c reductase cytochrome b subunit [Kineosporia sp. A_224]|uniref:cytochrome bc1 complex cytochrome b subunit n=1 Tax=Kineosporia sp. A_224 TaxID=1962180 RepID=UPI000B4BFD01|nr:ubiquinol-cytochrome c reductase cytochrome b subunit [Kineosporia sp. A_224]